MLDQQPLDAEPHDTALDDAWLRRRAPAGAGPWAPLPNGLADEAAVRKLADRWTDQVVLRSSVDGPEGPVRASPGRTMLLGMLLVWVPAG